MWCLLCIGGCQSLTASVFGSAIHGSLGLSQSIGTKHASPWIFLLGLFVRRTAPRSPGGPLTAISVLWRWPWPTGISLGLPRFLDLDFQPAVQDAQWDPSQFRLQADGTFKISIRGMASMTGIDQSGLVRSLKSAEDVSPLLCPISPLAQGFYPADVMNWGETGGIPEDAAPYILRDHSTYSAAVSNQPLPRIPFHARDPLWRMVLTPLPSPLGVRLAPVPE